ncbi:VOC family protein [Candidatus Saccharibacteria bacterium]|nr:VOC family protein [Candidatus Saccharibacteria bacterium]
MNYVHSFSGVSVSNIDEVRQFYLDTLGLELVDETMGLKFKLPGGGELFVYEKEDHTSAGYTVLSLVVEDIEKAVEELKDKGVEFEKYDLGGGAKTDEMDIMRGKAAQMGPDIAWFKDPAGNFLAVLED